MTSMSADEHIAAARNLLDLSANYAVADADAAWIVIARAQTHATLALAEQVGRLIRVVKVKP